MPRPQFISVPVSLLSFSLLLLSPLLPFCPLKAPFPFQDCGEPLPTFLFNSMNGSDHSRQCFPNCHPKFRRCMTCMASPFLPLRAGFLDGHMRSINMLGGGVGVGERRGGEGGHKDSWNSYPYSLVKASGSTTSIGQPKLETPGHHNSY